MQTIFVMVKCELGKAYAVADDAVAVEQISEVYSTSGQYDLLMKCYLDEKTDIVLYQRNAEDLGCFGDSSVDVVTSHWLFHEMPPRAIRNC